MKTKKKIFRNLIIILLRLAVVGVPSENIFMDHAGFSTYETLYRAKELFEPTRLLS